MFEKVNSFLKGVRGEIARVSWPTRNEVIAFTGLVLLVVVLLTLYIWGVDTVVQGVLQFLIQL